MEISKILLYFYVLILISAADYAAVLPCSDEMLCQPGFLCSAKHMCMPIDTILTLFPTPHSQVNDVHSSRISSKRIVRKVKQHNADDKNREMLVLMGSEGNEDNDHREPTAKDEHRKYKPHHPHKHRKGRVHRRDVDVVSMFEGGDLNSQKNETTDGLEPSILQDSDGELKLLEMLMLNPMEKWNAYKNNDKFDSKSNKRHRAKRFTPSTTSQWQKALDLLNHGKMGGATHQSTNSESTRQLEILEEIKQRLEDEVAGGATSQHGHHNSHLSGEVESKREEISVLKGIETLLQHTDLGAVHGGHSNEQHHNKYGQQHKVGSLTSDTGDHSSHGHSRTHSAKVQPDLDSLEELVLEDVIKAEREGLTKKQGVDLREEIEGLEMLEKQSAEDLIENSKSQTSLSELEKRVQLWGVIEQFIEKLKTEFPNTQRSREERSAQVDNTKAGSLLSLLQHALTNLQAHSHRKQTVPVESTIAPTSKSPTPAVTSENTEVIEEKEEIGRVDQDHCHRCEPLVGEEVCGANGKTYVSLCHAVNCAGLRENDIIAGRCIEEDECASNECSEREECVPMVHGTCLALYSKNGFNRVPCRRFACVAKGECEIDIEHAQICGEDGKTYPSLCYLHKAAVQLAYTGSCRPNLCRAAVCGRDGVTYESSCHARAHGVRIDYNGECFTEDKYSKLVNCATVRDAGRCVKLHCSEPIIPAGACCPVCGGAVIVDPDSAALSELVASWEEINHLYVVENFLRHLLSKDELAKCELTATLTNSGSFSVVLSATNPTDHVTCRNAGKDLVQTINKKTSTTQDAMLHPVAMKATLINPFNPESMIKGYLLQSQEMMMSKATELQDQATNSANDALVDVDRQVQNRQYDLAVERGVSKSLGQSSLLSMITLWTFTCTVLCIILQ